MDADATRVWWKGLVRRVAYALLASAALSFLTSMLLFGLPHGWNTATSWADIRLRTSWIAGLLVPLAVVTHLPIHVRRRRRPHPDGRYRPRDLTKKYLTKGGRHR